MPRTGRRPLQIEPSGFGAPCVVDGVRAAGQDDRPDAAPLQLRERRVVGQQLRVDVELADPARDQLGELASRSPGRRRRRARARSAAVGGSVGAAVGRGRVERDLEVGLDLRVVRTRGRGGRRWPPPRGRSCRASARRGRQVRDLCRGSCCSSGSVNDPSRWCRMAVPRSLPARQPADRQRRTEAGAPGVNRWTAMRGCAHELRCRRHGLRRVHGPILAPAFRSARGSRRH